MTKYKITYYLRGREKTRKFDTLADAEKVAQHVYEATGVVVGIETLNQTREAK